MSQDVTLLLQRVQNDPSGVDALLRAVYDELRKIGAAKMAREAPGHTLQATALVHEAWSRLVDEDGRVSFQNRAHFFCAAAEAMRRILVDRARAKSRGKRGNGAQHVSLDDLEITAPTEKSEELLLVSEALEKLSLNDARKAEVVKLHYFAGFTFEETAQILGISVITANRHWAYARAWLHEEISHSKK